MSHQTTTAQAINSVFAMPVRAPVIRTGEREPISPLLRQLVYRRDRWTCQYCGRHPFTPLLERRSGPLHLDHIIPWSAGGEDRSYNLRTLCGPCNESRSNYVSSQDVAATPIVRICTPCLASVDERIRSLCDSPADRFTVYCGSHSHESWAMPGWRIL